MSKAPIREALLDIRVRPLPESRLPALEKLHSSVSGEFPAKQILHEHQFDLGIKLGMEPEASVSSGRLPRGVVFKNAEGDRIVQFRLDGFTFNWLRPYRTWEDLRSAALSLWALYAKSIEPEVITRLALRYINLLTVPSGSDFDDFLAAGPRVPAALPQVLSRFVTRLTVLDAGTHCQAHITQAFSGERDDNGGLSLTLDIDAYREIQLAAMEDATIAEMFETLHEFKNRAFFSSITEDAAKMYE